VGVGAALVERAAHEAGGVAAAAVLRSRLHGSHPADGDEPPGDEGTVVVDRDAAHQLGADEGAPRAWHARHEGRDDLVGAAGEAEAPLAESQEGVEVVGRQAAVVGGVRGHAGGAVGSESAPSSSKNGRNIGRSTFVRSTIVVSVRSTPSSMNSRSRKPSRAAGVATRTLAM
jgi:hypothetical protein